jgi:hypothetical protein
MREEALMGGGDTQVGGNGSVYWRSTHYDGSKKKRKMKVKSGSKHGNDEIDLGQDDAFGRDEDTKVTEVGARLGHSGFFLVTLRYQTMDDARLAGAWVAEHVRPGEGGFILTVRVPAIDRSSPDQNPPYEVKVEW